VGEGSCGGGHQDGLQGREGVRRLGEHAAGNEEPDVVAGFLVRGVLAQPVVEGDGVQLPRLGVGPGFGGADLGRQSVQQRGELVHFSGRGGADRERVAGVADQGAVRPDVDGLPFAVAGVRFQAEFVQQGQQCGLVRRYPLAADLEHGTVHGVGPRPAAHPVAGLQHGHGQACLFQLAGGGEAGGACSYDHYVAVKIQHDVLSLWPRK
jgi:hypothetical protein